MHLAGNCRRAKSVKGESDSYKLGGKLCSFLSAKGIFSHSAPLPGPPKEPASIEWENPVLQMGCTLSSTGDTTDPAVSADRRGSALGLDEKGTDGSHGEREEAFPLSEAQKEWIRGSWNILHKNIARVGIIVFIGLFETHPECKDVFFLFRDVDDLQQLKMSKELQAHGLRVMSFVEKSVTRLDQEDKLELLAFELGKNHYHYRAPPNYYEYIGIQFIQAVRPILKDDWTLEVEKAWEGLFRYLAAVMRRGFHNEGKSLGASPLLPPQTADVESAPDRI